MSTGTATGGPAAPLRAVAVFEACKGVVALLAAGALGWLGAPQLQRLAESLAARVGAPLDRDRVAWLERVFDAGTLDLVLVVLLLYAAVRFVEAWGLWRARGWASSRSRRSCDANEKCAQKFPGTNGCVHSPG